MGMQHSGPVVRGAPQRRGLSTRGRRIARRIALTVFIVVASISALIWARYRPAIAPAASASSAAVPAVSTQSIIAEQPQWGTALVAPTAPSISTNEGVSPNLNIKAKKSKGKAHARGHRRPASSVAER